MKRCSKCKETKPLGCFFSDKSRPSGLRSRCKICEKKAINLELHAKSQREWVKANSKNVKEINNRWRLNHPEEYRQIRKRWRLSHPEIIRKRKQERRARKLSSGGQVTPQEWQALLDFYGNICLCCRTPAQDTPEGYLTQDHIIPLKKGGGHEPSNLQPLCNSCNAKKYTKETDYRPRPLPDFINDASRLLA